MTSRDEPTHLADWRVALCAVARAQLALDCLASAREGLPAAFVAAADHLDAAEEALRLEFVATIKKTHCGGAR